MRECNFGWVPGRGCADGLAVAGYSLFDSGNVDLLGRRKHTPAYYNAVTFSLFCTSSCFTNLPDGRG